MSDRQTGQPLFGQPARRHLVDLSGPEGPFRAQTDLIKDRRGLPVLTVTITDRLSDASGLRELSAVEQLEKEFAERVAACLNFCHGATTEQLAELATADLSPLQILGAATFGTPGLGAALRDRLGRTA
jgi:hypothetical protein